MIALGCDHGGYDLKQVVIAYLEEKGIPYKDFGCMDKSSCDYPVFGRAAAGSGDDPLLQLLPFFCLHFL